MHRAHSVWLSSISYLMSYTITLFHWEYKPIAWQLMNNCFDIPFVCNRLFIRKWDGEKYIYINKWVGTSCLRPMCKWPKWERESQTHRDVKKAMNPMDRKLEVPDYVILFKMVPLFSVVVVAIRRCPCVSQMPSGKNGKCLCLYLFTI